MVLAQGQRRDIGQIVLVGCGRLGSVIVEGWLATGAVDPARLVILAPSAKPAAEVARAAGAAINPSPETLAQAGAMVLAVKPGVWRDVAAPLAGHLAPDAVVVSVMAGVRTAQIGTIFPGRPTARVMPTTAVAQAQGVAALWSTTDAARSIARALFDPVAEVVELDEERHIDVATAVAGSGPAYVHAFTQALARAAQAAGLDPAAALALARGAVRSAAASAQGEATLEQLIGQVASPGGTTEAGLKALNAAGTLDEAVEAAVAAALLRTRQLSG